MTNNHDLPPDDKIHNPQKFESEPVYEEDYFPQIPYEDEYSQLTPYEN